MPKKENIYTQTFGSSRISPEQKKAVEDFCEILNIPRSQWLRNVIDQEKAKLDAYKAKMADKISRENPGQTVNPATKKENVHPDFADRTEAIIPEQKPTVVKKRDRGW